MAELLNALIIVLCVNCLLWMGQVAVTDLNPTGPSFYNCTDSMAAQFDTSNCQGTNLDLNNANPATDLPTAGSTVTGDNGNFFTDTFSSILNWITQTTGLNYLFNILGAPVNFLKAIGVPNSFSVIVGILWYATTLFLVVAFVFGRDT